MNRLILFCCTLFLWGTIGKMSAQSHEKKLFVLLGQSNMAGRAFIEDKDTLPLPMVKLLNDQGVFELAKNPLNRYSSIRKELSMQKLGLGYTFSKKMSESFYKDTIYLIVNARGGMAIEEFFKENPNHYYEKTCERIRQALHSDPDLKLTAILWHQGESNVKNYQSYLSSLRKVVRSLREDLNAPEALFVVGGIGEWVANNKGISEVIAQIPEHIPHTAVVSAQGLTHIGDQLHFDSNSQHILGNRYAEAVIKSLGGCQDNANYPFRNPDLPIEERVEDLLKRLTLKEKVGQMRNYSPAIERLGILDYNWWNEALHGVARSGRATVFPQAIAMAATFDEKAVHETFVMVSDEARAKYNEYRKNREEVHPMGLTFWTPNVNIFRDPRWGRGMETYGEDPYLTERMGLAVVKGLQGDDPKYFKTHACAKHYAVHSGPEWNRHEFDVTVSPRDLWQTYLPAFEALVKEGNVQEVMCAYNRYEGKPCCGSDKLLIDILRNSWGYKHIILSDCGAINDFWERDKQIPRHETHENAESASAAAVLSGTDLECGGNSYLSLVKAVEDGKILEEDINVSLRRVLKGRFELGMFDPEERVPFTRIPYSVVESPEHVAKALEMARKSMVLLKNEKQTLPLSKKLKKIAVVGPNAADSAMLWANYNGYPTHTVTILEGIQKKVPDAEIIYDMGCDYVKDTVVRDLYDHITNLTEKGFAAEFFNNVNLQGQPVYKGTAEVLDYVSRRMVRFAPNVAQYDFSARFIGELEAPETGEVEIRISGNNTFRLFVGNEKVIDTWKRGRGEQVYRFNVKEGERYPVKIEYLQRKRGTNFCMQIGMRHLVDYAKVTEKVKEADVIIYVGGLSPRLEGEEMAVLLDGFKKGDRTNIEVPKVQREMMKALKSTGKPLVYVLCTGGALALNWEDSHVDAILNAWYGGQEAGTAVADILFGDYNPSGRLPVTFYKSTDQLPNFENYEMQGRTYRYMQEAPLYPFGYGLSYTHFNYKHAKLSNHKIKQGESVILTFDVINVGKKDGDEVIQIYIKNPKDPEGPIKSLKGFTRVHVKAGKSQNVRIKLSPEVFYSFNDKTQTMEIRLGKYYILYGGSSDDKKLKSIDLEIE